MTNGQYSNSKKIINGNFFDFFSFSLIMDSGTKSPGAECVRQSAPRA